MAQATDSKPDDKSSYKFASSDGTFKRQVSSFRSWISEEPGARFPPEKDRYVYLIALLFFPPLLLLLIPSVSFRRG
jgi:putative glutathione S-transferase